MNYLHFFKSHSNSMQCVISHGWENSSWLLFANSYDLPSFLFLSPLCNLSPASHLTTVLLFPPAFPLGSESAIFWSLPYLVVHCVSFAVSSPHILILFLHFLHAFPSDLTHMHNFNDHVSRTYPLISMSNSLSWELVFNFQFSAGCFHPHVLLSVLQIQTIFFLLISSFLWPV